MRIKKGWRRSRRRGVQRRTTPARMSERWTPQGGTASSASDCVCCGSQRGGVKVSCEIFQTEVGLMSNLNELIACKISQACAVVDPAFEVDRLLREAKQRGWTITTVLVTHTHHDHVDGVEAMVKATGATVYVGAGEVEALRRAAPSAKIVGLSGGETIEVGELRIASLPTPGTPQRARRTSPTATSSPATRSSSAVVDAPTFPAATRRPCGRACSGWRHCRRRRGSIPGTITGRRRRRRSRGRRRPTRTCCARARRSSWRCARDRTRRGRRSAPNDARAQLDFAIAQ